MPEHLDPQTALADAGQNPSPAIAEAILAKVEAAAAGAQTAAAQLASITQLDTLARAAEWASARGAFQVDTSTGRVWIMPYIDLPEADNPFDTAAAMLLAPPIRRAAYSDRTAWLMAEFSRLAYLKFESDPSELQKLMRRLKAAGLELVGIVDNRGIGTQAYVARAVGRFSVLVFRGTEKNFSDIKTDLDARFTKVSAGMVAQGFITAFKAVADSIEPLLKNVSESEPLYITGHSLGGALATVAASELNASGKVLAACYTFGSPRVGDAEWADRMKEPVYRIVNAADGVPLLPGSIFEKVVLGWIKYVPVLRTLEPWIGRIVKSGYVGYQHVGDVRFLSGTIVASTLKTGSAATWLRTFACATSFTLGIIRLNLAKLSGFYRDHAMAEYCGKLRRIALDRL